jgi:hypothetical protein
VSDQDPGPLPELTSEQEETVRRLLAEARHDDPVPAEVADRLDRVLADLSGTASSPSSPSAPVVDLATRRRRRNAGGLLVAAAAVIVGGFFVGQVIDVGGSDSADDDSSAGSSVERESRAGGAANDSDDGTAGGAGDQAAPEAPTAQPLELTSQNLARDLQRQLKGKAADAHPVPDAPALSLSDGGAFACASAPPEAYGRGKFFAAFYDGMPTVLALRPAEGDTQEAQVLECGTGTPLQSVTVPAP